MKNEIKEVCERKVKRLIEKGLSILPSGLSTIRLDMNYVSDYCRKHDLSIEKYLQLINDTLKESFKELEFETQDKQYFTGLLITQPNNQVVLEFFTTDNNGQVPTLFDISKAN